MKNFLDIIDLVINLTFNYELQEGNIHPDMVMRVQRMARNHRNTDSMRDKAYRWYAWTIQKRYLKQNGIL